MRTRISLALITFLALLVSTAALQAQRASSPGAGAAEPTVMIESPMPAPDWAFAQRALLRKVLR